MSENENETPVCALTDPMDRPDVNEDELDDLQRCIEVEQRRLDDMKRTSDGLRKRADLMDKRREEGLKALRLQRIMLRQGKIENELYETRRRVLTLEAMLAQEATLTQERNGPQ